MAVLGFMRSDGNPMKSSFALRSLAYERIDFRVFGVRSGVAGVFVGFQVVERGAKSHSDHSQDLILATGDNR